MDFKLAPLEPGKAYHVVVTYKSGLLVCYLNGKIAARRTWRSDLSTSGMGVAIRSSLETKSVACGHGKAIWTVLRSTTDLSVQEEAARKFELAGARLAQRPMIDRKIVKAEMLQKADSPPPDAIAPYRRALVVNRYKIKEARDSQLVNQTVQVAEWALLDAKIPSTYADARPGQVLELESRTLRSASSARKRTAGQ